MLKLYADGACSGNPGPGGWAYWITNIFDLPPSIPVSDKGRADNTTNNRMEMSAIIEGLKNIWNIYGDTGLVEVITDSNLIVQTMTSGWKRNVNIDLWDALDALVADMVVKWTWAPRNSTPELMWCDKKAKEMSNLINNPIKESLPPLKTLQKEIHETAVSKGWWPGDRVRNVGEIFTNIHAEISEAWELHRMGISPQDVWLNAQSDPPNKPEGIGIELADTIIRILDYAEANDLDMDALLRQKMEYNEYRPFRHGDKLV